MPSSIFPSIVQLRFEVLEAAVNSDDVFQASSKGINTHFAFKSSESDETLDVKITNGVAKFSVGSSAGDPVFTLSARAEDWRQFFEPLPRPPFQSYWGILRQLGHEPGNQILGDVVSFGRYARLWRQILDHAREAVNGNEVKRVDTPFEDEEEDDVIVGRYLSIETDGWGRSKVFYESSGTGPQNLLLLHTAGADSRQYHSLMNNKSLCERCTMYAFDLPGHGRSYPGSKQVPLGHHTDEDRYIGTIAQFIKKLKLSNVIVSGASMAGHVCLAVALRAAELGVIGVIPCEAAEHLPLHQPKYELAGDLNEAVLNPERVCGMISPTSPEVYKRNIWWTYSSQAVRIFTGDLEFYFRGWDGRGRIQNIDTKVCPVFMLTGEYDYSCTPAISAATATKIPGAVFETMLGLGHFPATEDPARFFPYLMKGLDYIHSSHKLSNGKISGLNGYS